MWRSLPNPSEVFLATVLCLLFSTVAYAQTESSAKPDTLGVTSVVWGSRTKYALTCPEEHDASTTSALLGEGMPRPEAAIAASRDGTSSDHAVGGAQMDQPAVSGEAIVAVQVNGRPMGDFVRMYRDPDGHWYAPADLLKASRLLPPTAQPLRINGEEYFPLASYIGVTFQFDATRQLLSITMSAKDFQTLSILGSTRVPATPMVSDPGFFLNNDIQVAGSGSTVQVSGVEELGFFSKLGVLTTQYAARDLTQHWAATRLQTQFFRDFPKKMATLTIGDSVTPTFASWGNAVNFAGVRWASNFSTQPTFVPFQLPSIIGSAAQPSTVDLYVNGLRAVQQTVPEGPFSISDIPVMSAVGNIQMVVTDMLGRQQIVSLPYISAQQLLRKKVSEYSFESGVERQNFGWQSDNYGTWFASGTYRRGLTDTFTLNLHGEVLLNSQTFGAGFDYGLVHLGVLSAGLAISHDTHGHTAGLAYGQLQHVGRRFGVSSFAQAAQPNFRQLGLLLTQHPTQFVGLAQASYSPTDWVTLSAGLMHQDKPTYPVFDADNNKVEHFNTVSSSINFRVWRGAMLTFSGNYTPEFKQKASGTAILVIPLQKRRLLTASTGYQATGTSPSVDYMQQPPPGTGWGYRARISSSHDVSIPRVDAGITYQNDFGAYRLEASQQQGSPINWLFNYLGGAVLLHRDALLSRQLNDSFAVVDTNGASGLKVMANNAFIATTDWRGLAVVPILPPYVANSIALDESSVPLDLNIDLGEKTIVPWNRSGLLVKFKAQEVNSVLLALVTEDGKPLPTGAEIKVNGDSEVYEVALRGEVYIAHIAFPATVHAKWEGVSCEASVVRPESNEPLPKIGPVTCRSMK